MKGQENRLGALLVRDHVITQAQLNHGLQVQKEQEDRLSLGEILMGLGFVNRRRLREAIQQYGKRAMFGEVLVESGAITREQLEEALEQQNISGGALGKILVEKAILTEEQLARTLSRQLDIPYMIPRLKMIDIKVFSRLPQSFLERHSVIPVLEANGATTVIVADPTDQPVIQALEDTFGLNLNLAISSRSEIDKAIQSLMRRRRFGASPKRGGAGQTGEQSLSPGLVIQGEQSLETTEEAMAVDIFDALISDALEERASDIHIEPLRDRLRVRHRIDGVLLVRTEFPMALAKPIVQRAKALAKLDVSQKRRQQEGRLLVHVDDRQVDLRVSICPGIFGESLAIRVFSRDTGLMDIEDLGMVPTTLARYQLLVQGVSGLTLFVGPTGVGKTTSFYATLNFLNDGSRKIITVEAPVEFPMDGAVQNNIPAADSGEIRHALLGSLHLDPDIIALGEITSDETASALLETGLVGHKVFSTQHAEDAASALVRLGQVQGAAAFLSSCSLVIIAQRLVRTVCPNCAEVYVPTPDAIAELQIKDFDSDCIDFRAGAGCPECLGTGYRGRTGIFEMMAVEPEMRRMLLEKPSASEIRKRMAMNPGFISLKQAGILKAVRGMTTVEEILRVVPAVDADLSEDQQLTLEELARRSGVALEEQGMRQSDAMVRTPIKTTRDPAS